MILLRLCILTLSICVYSVSADNTIKHTHNNNTILIVGDSLSAAYGIDQDKGWVKLLDIKLDNDSEHQWQVINASISGDTTAGGLARLPNLLDQYSPVLCIIALGGNDGLRGLSLTAMKSNLESMLTQCNNNGTSLLIGMQIPPNYGKKYTQAFYSVYTNLAEKYDVGFVPFMLDQIADQEEYFLADLIHPNEHAQKIILDNIWTHLEPMLNTNSVVKVNH